MNWKPACPDDLIGQARRVAKAQVAKARRLASVDPPTASIKLLLYGPPGVGKTSVVEMVSRELTGSPLAVLSFNGREVTVDFVRDWMKNLAYGNLFSRRSVRIVNELDRLPPGRALLGTSNLQLDLLMERFQTWFQSVTLLPPATEVSGVSGESLAGAEADCRSGCRG